MTLRTLLARSTLLLLALGLAATPAATQERLRTLVLTGEDEAHDWRWTSTYLRQILEESGKFRVEIETVPAAVLENATALSRYGLIVVDYDGIRWGEAAETNFIKAVQGGTGLVLLHAANGAFPDWKAYRDMTGLTRAGDGGEAPFEAVTVKLLDKEHPVSAGLEGWRDQPDGLLYGWKVQGEGATVLARGTSEGWGAGEVGGQPIALASKVGEGRVFQLLLGHVGHGDERSWGSWRDPRFQQLLLRGTEWASTGKVTPMSKFVPNTLSPADRAAGWRLLAQGEGNRGWRGFEEGLKDRWKVEGGSIYLLSEEGEPLHDEPFQDFEFELEWRVSDEALAAYIASQARAGRTPPPVSADDPDSLVDARIQEGVLPEAAYVLRPPGEWNHVRIVAQGYQVEHWLNGIRVLTIGMDSTEWAALLTGTGWLSDPDLGRMPLGRLAQLEAGIDVMFRNVKIRPLIPQLEALAADVATPTALFNGRDFTGWVERWWAAGEPRDLWTYDDEGNVVCKGNRLDYLCTRETYTDFLLELDYRWNPVSRLTGNTSLLLHMQADQGFLPQCLEVRLQFRDLGAIWSLHDFPYTPDPERARGALTTIIERADAHAGEWNAIAVRSQGGRLTVHANGVLVNELTGVSQLPGHLGLKSEDAEFHLRNVRLTEL